ncbi:GNAT family N-acetyltransferase [Sulfolobus tengchongensis]|uniref:GNAT family N-acetyltransferase n=1 Tax=Sulfolobus tengchongensis TaxID=207809 RepID=A0AAX4L1F8_9CREN
MKETFKTISDIVELTPQDEDMLEEMYSLYQKLFPVKEEAETIENLKKYLSLKETSYYGQNNYHILIAKTEGKVIGFVIGDYYAEASVGIIEFLAVAEEFRGKGLGSMLEKAFVEKVSEDAKKVGKEVKGILIEVEDIEKGMKNNSILFWVNLGYKLIPIKYIQPPLSPGKHRAENLRLMYKPLDESDEINGKTLLNAIKDYFKYAMSIDNPEETEEYKIMSSQIKASSISLEHPGTIIPHEFSIHILFSVDLFTLGESVKVFDRTNENIMKNISKMCKEGTISCNSPEVRVRKYRDEINLTPYYIEHRKIIRFELENPIKLSVLRSDGEEIGIDANVKLLGLYKSNGILMIELVIRSHSLILPTTLISMVQLDSLKINGQRAINFITETIRKLINKDVKEDIDVYPIFFIKGYYGKLKKENIYGFVDLDPSFMSISKGELKRVLRGSNVSVVKGIMVMYESRASLVLCKNKSTLLNNFEEIFGVPLHTFLSDFTNNEIEMAIESEYLGEIEVLREQLVTLTSLYHFLVSKRGVEKIGEEYETLISLERRLYRRLLELNVLDIGLYESVREVIRLGQKKMGIDNLYVRVKEAAGSLSRELDVRYQLSENRKLEIVQYLLVILAIIQIIEAGSSFLRTHVFPFIPVIGITFTLLLLAYFILLRNRRRRRYEE